MRLAIEAVIYRESQWDVYAIAEEASDGSVELRDVRAYINKVDVTAALTADELHGVAEALLDAYDRARPSMDDEIDRRRKARKERQ